MTDFGYAVSVSGGPLSPGGVTGISVLGDDGNDTLRIDASTGTIPATLDGGNGDDTLIGGNG